MKILTEKEKKSTNFTGEIVYKNKGKEIDRVLMADQEQVQFRTKKGIDPSFKKFTGLNIPQERFDKIFNKERNLQ